MPGFLEALAHEARLRVFERGVGETLACGTGACAAVASGIRVACSPALSMSRCLAVP